MIEKYRDEIISIIGEKRFEHTIRVSEEAQKLAIVHGVDPEKAKIAGMFHDCAKIRDLDKLLEKCREYNFELTHDMYYSPQIIHSFLGAEIANKRYGIDDIEILDAIRFHTTGRANMSMLEKVIYLADYIEPMRNFDGVERARKLSYEDIDLAMLESLNNTILFLANKMNYIAKYTFDARNYLLEMKNGKVF